MTSSPSASLVQVLAVSLRKKIEATGKDPGALTHSLTDLRNPTFSKAHSLSIWSLYSHLQGSCHLVWPWQAWGTDAQADPEGQLPLLSPCRSGLGAAALPVSLLCLAARLAPRTSAGPSGFSGWGRAWEVSLFTPSPLLHGTRQNTHLD